MQSLRDEPGVLSSVLVLLHQLNANILTVNQTIPIDGVAAVTISLRLNGSMDKIYTIKAGISQLTGVVDVKAHQVNEGEHKWRRLQ